MDAVQLLCTVCAAVANSLSGMQHATDSMQPHCSAAMDALQPLCTVCAAAVTKLLWAQGATKALRPTATSATANPTRASARARCARVRTRRNCLRRRQHATCDNRRTACNTQHATCNGRHAADDPQHPYILRPCRVWQMTRDQCRAASCSATGAAQLHCAVVRQASRTVGIPPPPPPHPHTHTGKKSFFRQCRSVCGASAEIEFERKTTNARVRTMSTWPNIDVLWCEHWHHWADRRARRGERTSSNAGHCCSACNTKPNP